MLQVNELKGKTMLPILINWLFGWWKY